MQQGISKTNALKILRTVPFEQGFHFNAEKGVYTGITATSLTDFYMKLGTVDVNSVLFHYPRGDFQKWIQEILGDKEFSDKLCFIESNLSGENLRKELSKMVEKRITELKTQMPFLS